MSEFGRGELKGDCISARPISNPKSLTWINHDFISGVVISIKPLFTIPCEFIVRIVTPIVKQILNNDIPRQINTWISNRCDISIGNGAREAVGSRSRAASIQGICNVIFIHLTSGSKCYRSATRTISDPKAFACIYFNIISRVIIGIKPLFAIPREFVVGIVTPIIKQILNNNIPGKINSLCSNRGDRAELDFPVRSSDIHKQSRG